MYEILLNIKFDHYKKILMSINYDFVLYETIKYIIMVIINR